MNWNSVHNCWVLNDNGLFIDYIGKDHFKFKGGGLKGAEFEAWQSAINQLSDTNRIHNHTRVLLMNVAKKIKNGAKTAKTLERWTKTRDELMIKIIETKILMDTAETHARELGWGAEPKAKRR
jgi:hypothetical protein